MTRPQNPFGQKHLLVYRGGRRLVVRPGFPEQRASAHQFQQITCRRQLAGGESEHKEIAVVAVEQSLDLDSCLEKYHVSVAY